MKRTSEYISQKKKRKILYKYEEIKKCKKNSKKNRLYKERKKINEKKSKNIFK